MTDLLQPSSYPPQNSDTFSLNNFGSHTLKQRVSATLARGKEELKGAGISVVLLSGGSANIGWLQKLIERDFKEDLFHAQILGSIRLSPQRFWGRWVRLRGAFDNVKGARW